MPLGASRLSFLAYQEVEAVGRDPVSVTAYGDAQIDTAQSKFGGASALFDGTNDYLACDAPIIPESGDFTVECWFRTNITNSNRDLFSQYTAGTNGRTNLYTTSAGKLGLFIGGTNSVGLVGTTTINTGTWYHAAGVRNGNNFYIFLNGNLEASTTVSGVTVLQTKETWLGAWPASPADADWSGWIDEARISNTARYTSSFTAPTAAFTNNANTLLLLHMDGTDGSTTFTDDNS